MPKRDQVNIRIKPELKADLDVIAEYHGLTVSSYVHSLLVKQIRIEKEATPEAFPLAQPIGKVIATIGSPKAEIQRQFDQGIPLAAAKKSRR